jgi:ABC-2 type transport system permease protein
VTGRAAIALVARRELSERVREKTFLVSTVVSVVVIACVALLPAALGFGGQDEYTVAISDPSAQPVAEAAVRGADAFDAKVRIVDGGSADATLTGNGIHAVEKPDDKLVNIVQAANARVRSAEALRGAGLDRAEAARALSPPPLRLTT